MLQKCKQTFTTKVNPAYCKISRANLKVNGAFAQSRLGGILCALAHGKLCFLQQTIVFAAKNHLPHCFRAGGETQLRSRAFPNYNVFYRLSASGLTAFTTKIQMIWQQKQKNK